MESSYRQFVNYSKKFHNKIQIAWNDISSNWLLFYQSYLLISNSYITQYLFDSENAVMQEKLRDFSMSNIPNKKPLIRTSNEILRRKFL